MAEQSMSYSRTAAVTTETSGPSELSQFMAKATAFLTVYTIFYEAFGGAIRAVLVKTGTLFVNNIHPVLSILLFFGYYVVCILKNEKIEKFMIYFAAIIGICIVHMGFTDISLESSVFGFYVWAPFLLGTLLGIYGKERTFFKFLFFLWASATVGIIINYFVAMPWAGLSYEVNGAQMGVTKQWYANGYARLAGFGRANYSAAGVTLMSCAYILSSYRYSNWVKLFVYPVSMLVIFLTTSKTSLLVLILLPLFILTYRHLKFIAPKSKIHTTWARAILMVMAATIILMPLLLGEDSFSGLSGQYMFFSASSMIDRITHTWPMNFHVLRDSGGNFIWGRGLGGIGTPQIFMTREAPDKSTSDSLFLYTLLSAGMIGVIPMFWALVRNLKKIAEENTRYFEIIAAFTFCILGLGMTENLIEDPIHCLFLGFLMSRGFVDPKIDPDAVP